MSASLFFIVAGASLFMAVFLTKRRFGFLGLALAAGALISDNWTNIVTPAIEHQGISTTMPPLDIVVRTTLLLLPSFLLLWGGPRYKGVVGRSIGGLLYALLTLLFMYGYFSVLLTFDTVSMAVALMIETYKPHILVALLGAAIIDTLLIRYPRFGKAKAAEH